MFDGGIAIGGVTAVVVVLPCFCCFFFRYFLIASTKTKRGSQRTTPTQRYGIASFNIPQTNSLVSSSKEFSNTVTVMYSTVSSSVSLAMLENTCIIDSASVFGRLLVFSGCLVFEGVLVVSGDSCVSGGDVGQIFVLVGGLLIGVLAAVILSCFCCLFLCFSITSTIAKRRSQTTAANFDN